MEASRRTGQTGTVGQYRQQDRQAQGGTGNMRQQNKHTQQEGIRTSGRGCRAGKGVSGFWGIEETALRKQIHFPETNLNTLAG